MVDMKAKFQRQTGRSRVSDGRWEATGIGREEAER